MTCGKPCAANRYLMEHVQRLLADLRRWTGRTLVEPSLALDEQARRIFHAPFVVLSHDAAADPLLNYANQAALELFEFTWRDLVLTPSRQTAEPLHRAERARLLAAVTRHGYVDDYHGIRISKNGRRFRIEKATVWNLLDDCGMPYGQAAAFSSWRSLDPE